MKGWLKMKDFIIADTHFESESLLRMENRPFKSVSEMNEAMIINWNKVVCKDDRVFHLGDFADLSTEDKKREVSGIIERLNGHIVLILGNHDRDFIDFYRGFEEIEIYEFPIVYKEFWVLSHEPMYVSENMPYANIFGHVHNSPMYKTVSSRSFCACVERIGYKPISFEDIKAEVLNCLK